MRIKLAIVGRPNVGKSTLFNRLAGKKIALVDDQPGVTRDRKEAKGSLSGLPLSIIDTAGYENVDDGSLEARMRAQTERAIEEADIALFLIDARAGVTPIDAHFSALLRKADMPVILAANKCEGKAGLPGLYEAYRLGLGEPVALSAEHGEGFGDLFEALRTAIESAFPDNTLADFEETTEDVSDQDAELIAKLDSLSLDETDMSDEAIQAALEAHGLIENEVSEVAQTKTDQKPIRLAIVGRPNAGKSTLINALLQDDRLLTGPEAGITRDSIAIDWHWQGRQIRLVDTAGLRKRVKVTANLERMSTGETVRSLKYADIIALVMDANEAFEKQDLQIADLALREGRGLVLVAAKWDQVEHPGEVWQALKEKSERLLPNAGQAPILTLSALTGQRLNKFIPAVTEVYDNWTAKTKTGDLNRWLRYAIERHPPPSVHGKRIKPRYIAQMKSRPPTFVLMASRGLQMPEIYKRYLVNGIREAFKMHGVPIRLFVRQSKNPYAHKATPGKPTSYAKGKNRYKG